MAKKAAKTDHAAGLKTYYSHDANGVYIGPVEAEIQPDNATEVPPPADGDETQSAVYNGVEWRKFPNATIDAAIKARARRDALLRECDYTQLPDFDGDAEPWAEYRQGLREVSKQEGFPLEIEWPSKPGATKKQDRQSTDEEMFSYLNDLVDKLSVRLEKVEKEKSLPVAK